MKKSVIVALVMAGMAAAPAYSQENIRKAYETVLKMNSFVVSEDHVNGDVKKSGAPVSHTDVYYMKFPSDEKETAREVIGMLRDAFGKDRAAATREFSHSPKISMVPPKMMKIGSTALEVILGQNPETDYQLGIFPEEGDTTGTRRRVYAIEWLAKDDGSTELRLVSDIGPNPQIKKTGECGIDDAVRWLRRFRWQITMVLENMKSINSGKETNITSSLYELCGKCPITDEDERRKYAGEVRKLAENVTVTLDKEVLLRAAGFLDKNGGE